MHRVALYGHGSSRMTARDLVSRVREHGARIALVEGKLAIIGRSCVPDDLAAAVRARVGEVKALLLEQADPLGSHTFTQRGSLCSRCKRIGRVAVVAGALTCTHCVVAAAEALFR